MERSLFIDTFILTQEPHTVHTRRCQGAITKESCNGRILFGQSTAIEAELEGRRRQATLLFTRNVRVVRCEKGGFFLWHFVFNRVVSAVDEVDLVDEMKVLASMVWYQREIPR